MNLGNSLFHARKKCGFSQEYVAEKLGVSRQTVSKWETDETVPDIRLKYQNKVNIPNYARRLNEMLDEIKLEYQFNEQDSMLVLKDILYNVWKNRKNKSNR